MYGNTLTRSVHAIGQMVQHPNHGMRWVANRINKKSPIQLGEPWTSWTIIDHLRKVVRPESRVFEWGGGGSTLFWARLGCRVMCVESNEFWKGQIIEELRRQGTELVERVEVKHVPAETGNPEDVRAYVEAVNTGAPWDIILVDGLEESYVSRVDCIKLVSAALAPGGMILLDDAWRPEYDSVPQILNGFSQKKFWGLGPARLGCTRTDLYKHSS